MASNSTNGASNGRKVALITGITGQVGIVATFDTPTNGF